MIIECDFTRLMCQFSFALNDIDNFNELNLLLCEFLKSVDNFLNSGTTDKTYLIKQLTQINMTSDAIKQFINKENK